MTRTSLRSLLRAGALAAVVALAAACAKSDSTTAEAKRKLDEAGKNAAAAVENAGAAVQETAAAVGDAAKEKVTAVGAEAQAKTGELVAAAKAKGAEAMAAAKEKTEVMTQELAAKRDQIVRDVQHRMGSIDAGIVTLQAKLDHAEGTAKQELADSLAAVRTKRAELRQSMAKLATSSGDAWDDVAAGIRKAQQELGEAIDKALARFK